MSGEKIGIKSAAVVGYGRFGELLTDLLAEQCPVSVVETDAAKAQAATAKGRKVVELSELGTVDFVFPCVPISSIARTAEEIAPYCGADQVVVDVCSVKTYPLEQLEKHLPGVSIIGTHPMFGPDSAKVGLAGSRLAMCPVSASDEQVAAVRNFWERYEVEVIETTAEQHDRDAVYSQAFAYIIAKIVIGMELPDITFRTRSYDWLAEIARLSSRDTEQLFHDIIAYNPYVKDMVNQLTRVTDGVETRVASILSERVID